MDKQVFQRKSTFENLHFSESNGRVTLLDEQTGTVSFEGSQWLFDQCLAKGIFEPVDFDKFWALSLFPTDRDPKWREVTINVKHKVVPLMEEILDKVNMTKDNYTKLARILERVVQV